MKKRISKSECTRKTEWNRPFLKILTFRSKSKLYLVKTFSFSSFFLFKIFFLQPVRTGSGFQVGPGQTGVVGDDVMALRLVSTLGACSALARRAHDISQLAHEAREMSTSARRSVWNDAGDHRTFWCRVGTRV